MNHFETMLRPCGKRLLSLQLNNAQDLNTRTAIRLLDNQAVLRSNTLYLGTAKMAAGILEGKCLVEPGCFLVIAVSNDKSLDMPQQLLGSYMASAQVFSSLSSLFNLVSEYIQTALPSGQHDSDGEGKTFEDFWQSVMDQRFTSALETSQALQAVNPRIHHFARILTIHFDEAREAEAYERLGQELTNIFPEGCICKYRNGLVLLISHEMRHLNIPFSPSVLEELNALMDKWNARLIYGHSFRKLDKLRSNFIQLERVCFLSRRLKLADAGRVTSYDRFSMYYVIDLAAQQYVHEVGHSDIIYLIHPAIILITRYDIENETNLRDTLFYYLQNGSNVHRTAVKTFMHRNTVINRINKIKSLTGLDLSDGGLCQRLMFSCQLIQYYERVLNLPLRLSVIQGNTKEGKGEKQ